MAGEVCFFSGALQEKEWRREFYMNPAFGVITYSDSI